MQIGCYVRLLLIWHWPEGTVMSGSEITATFRTYQFADYTQVAALWTRINRELV